MSDWNNNDPGWGTTDTGTMPWGNGDTANDGNHGFNDDFGAAMDTAHDNFEDAGEKPINDRKCYNCGEPGHNKADCEKPIVERKCFNCGEAGHVKQECPEPVVLPTCKNCGEEGHTASKCEAARKIDRSHLPDKTPEEAWDMIKRAVEERDIDDIKEAIQIYVKSLPETTYSELEEAFRAQDIGLWLIAIEKPSLAATLTNMDLQGNLGKKYTVTYRFQWNPPRPRDRELWPNDMDENIERLKDAGEVTAGSLPKCRNCNELGHIAKHCKQEKRDVVVQDIKCYNCDQTGHRVRDCPMPRIDKWACKTCGKSGHQAIDCPDKPEVECRKCNEVGHMARDCPTGGGNRGCRNCGQEGHLARDCTEPVNVANIQCRNCDEYGHMSKECPQPRNMDRVKCNNCQQFGHYASKCPNPAPEGEGDEGFENGAGHNDNFTTGDTSGWASSPTANGGDGDWAPAPVDSAEGGW